MLTIKLVAYISKVCIQRKCLHVPVPLSPLRQHLLPPLFGPEFSEAGHTQDIFISVIHTINNVQF